MATTHPRVRSPEKRLAARRPSWLRSYQLALVALDGILLAVAVLSAVSFRFPDRQVELHGFSYLVVALLVGLIWWASLALTRSYEARFLGEGPEEFKRVLQAAARIALVLGVVCYVGRLPLSRGFVTVVLPLGAVLLVAGRLGARMVLRAYRRTGACSHRVVAVGSSARVAELESQLRRSVGAGFQVVGACVPDSDTPLRTREIDELSQVAAMVARTGADTVAVTAWPGMTPAALRDLAYELEGSGVDLLVAPALLSIAGARVSIQPVAGLPLLQLQEAQLSGTGRFVKAVMDRSFAALALLALSPLLAVVALSVRVSSRGPVLISERRQGREGAFFSQYRVRCHLPAPPRDGVDRRGGPPAQRRQDRAPTPIGRLLEATHIDDLPQLVNVLRGEMSLVGPRAVVAGRRREDPHDQRRLLVKPGVTGLAQMSGRTIQDAAEASRLDQQYVDNWSFGLDVLILLKTAYLLVRGRQLT